MTPINQLRAAQALAHPASYLWPGEITPANVKGFSFSEIDNKCIALLARIEWKKELQESQTKWLNRLYKLIPVRDVPRINHMRLLIGSIVLKPADLKIEIQNSSVYGSNRVHAWNRDVFIAYFEMERRAYPDETAIKDCLSGILDHLEFQLSSYKRTDFHNAVVYDGLANGLQLLKDVCASPKELTPCLFLPVGVRLMSDFSKELMMLFRNALELAESANDKLTFEQIAMQKSDRAFAIEFSKISKRISAHLTEYKKKYDQILNLLALVKKGDRASYFYLYKLLENFDPNEHLRFQEQLLQEIHHREVQVWIDKQFSAAIVLLERFHRAALKPLLEHMKAACSFIERFQDCVSQKAGFMRPVDVLRLRWVDQIVNSKTAGQDLTRRRLMFLNLILLLFEQGKNSFNANITFNPSDFSECEWMDAIVKNCGGKFPHITHHWLIAPLPTNSHPRGISGIIEEHYRQFATVWTLLNISRCPWIHQILDCSDVNNPEKVLMAMESLKEAEYLSRLVSVIEEAMADKSENACDSQLALETFTLVRSLYVQPLFEMGWSATKTPLAKEVKTTPKPSVKSEAPVQEVEEIKAIELPVTLQKSYLEALDGLLKYAPRNLKVQMQSFIELLKKPVSLEALYEKAALCLEAHLKPEETHKLSSKGQDKEMGEWLGKMQHYLPISFKRPKISKTNVWEDVKRTAYCLGAESFQEGSITKMQLPRIKVKALQQLKDHLPKRGEFQCQELPEEQKIDVTLRNSYLDLICIRLSQFIDEIEPLFSLCQNEACSSECLSHLTQKTGLLVEGALKMHLMSLPIAGKDSSARHCSFDMVGQRPLRYDHHLNRLYDWIQSHVDLTSDEILLLEKWQDYATWTRYPDAIDTPLNTFLSEARLLYQDFHTEDEAKHVAKIGFPGGSKDELLRRQNEELIPDLLALYQLVDKLLLK